MHPLQALNRPINAALLTILSIRNRALNRCLHKILPQQPVYNISRRRTTLQLIEDILATSMAMDTFVGVKLLELLCRSLQPSIQIGPISEDAVLLKIPLLKRSGRQLLHVIPVLKIGLRSCIYGIIPIFGLRNESILLYFGITFELNLGARRPGGMRGAFK